MKSKVLVNWQILYGALGIFLLSFTSFVHSSVSNFDFVGGHPRLVFNASGVDETKSHLGAVPLFDASLEQTRKMVDAEMELGIDVPLPKDFSGGYSHERHKRNYIVAQKAGQLFLLLGDEKYAIYIRDMLLQYASIYNDLPLHPKERSYARGKLFWQCLNDSNWLLYMAQAYDAIYSWLPSEQTQTLNTNLFRPFADFISLENPQFFNRIHNHSAWGNAAVGMIGLVMSDEELVERALFGLQDDGIKINAKDNDGGFIKKPGQVTGFIANLEEPFSPDGYYTEGPYYQRYAMYPFLIFAVAMNNVLPDFEVLEYKDGVLFSAVHALLSLTDHNGEFFPLNDAQKGMSVQSASLVSAVNLAYYYGDRDPALLSVVEKQGAVMLNQAGMSAAIAIRDGQTAPYPRTSIHLTDGADGKQGGISVLRDDQAKLDLVFKYTAHGLSHGHYDKLGISVFHAGQEVLQDYGLVRFVNIEEKGGGNYLPENTTWAKQTIAHNTLVLNEKSHFAGDYAVGSQNHSDLYFTGGDASIQIVSAKETNAYEDTELHRTVAIVKKPDLLRPYIVDLYRVSSAKKNQYDLPFYYQGQMIDSSMNVRVPESLIALGKGSGYQHLYVEGSARSSSESESFTWLYGHRFYSLVQASEQDDQRLFVRLGASDPEFNLRRDPGMIWRKENAKSAVFASVLEAHGSYSPVLEMSKDAERNIDRLITLHNDQEFTALKIIYKNSIKPDVLVVANKAAGESKFHSLEIDGVNYRWQGPFLFQPIEG
ncbi:alginate lyase family protein [Halioxenophilus aromaticivorans]